MDPERTRYPEMERSQRRDVPPPMRDRFAESLGRYDDDRHRHEPPEEFSHYQNYHEIQAQLARHDYYQQRYHQYLAHQMALAHHHHHHTTSLSASQLIPPPVPPRGSHDFLAHSQHGGAPPPQHRAYPATEPRGNWADYRGHHLPSSSSSRSLTPGVGGPHEHARHSPSRPRATTPLGYHSHHSKPASTSSLLPSAAPLHASQHSYSLDFVPYEDTRFTQSQRQGAYGQEGSKTSYAPDSSQFGSLPRNTRTQNGTVSHAARV